MNFNIFPLFRKLPAGRYQVGDMCYVYPNEGPQFVHKLYENSDGLGLDNNGALIKFNDFWIFSTHTRHGDGYYELVREKPKRSFNLCVDSGSLSIIPTDLVDLWNPTKQDIDLGQIIEIKKDFYVKSFGGDFSFDNYSVKTS